MEKVTEESLFNTLQRGVGAALSNSGYSSNLILKPALKRKFTAVEGQQWAMQQQD